MIKAILNKIGASDTIKFIAESDIYVEIKNIDNPELYFVIEELEPKHFVLSILKEEEREIPFDLGGFNLSSKIDCDDNIDYFADRVNAVVKSSIC